MKYTKVGSSYQLAEDIVLVTPVKGHRVIDGRFTLSKGGILCIFSPFTWDGATGAIDTPSILKASLEHDVFCILINEGVLPVSLQPVVDKQLVDRVMRYWEAKKFSRSFWTRTFAKLIAPLSSIRQRWIYRAVRIYQANKRKGQTPKIYEV